MLNSGAPLVRFAEDNDLEMVELLIKSGADVDDKDDDGCTALIVAAYNDNYEIVEFLVSK